MSRASRSRPGFEGVHRPAMVLAVGAVAWRGLATRFNDIVRPVWLLVVARRLGSGS